MQASMDWRADPCRDFYAYACGGWARDAASWPPTAAQAAASLVSLQRLVDLQVQYLLNLASTISPYEKLGAFYTSCLRVKEQGPSYGPMLSLLEALGGYLAPGAPPPDLTALLGRLLALDGAPLLDVAVLDDPRRRQRAAPFLLPPSRHNALTTGGPGGPGPAHWRHAHWASRWHARWHALWSWRPAQEPWGWFEGEPPAEPYGRSDPWEPFDDPFIDVSTRRLRRRSLPKESRAYTFMKNSAEEKRLLQLDRLLRVFLPASLSKATRAKEAQSILLFASMLSKQFPREKEMFSRSEDSEPFEQYNITRLQEEFTFVEWQPLLEGVFGRNFSDDDPVYVSCPDYFRRLQTMLPHFQKRVVHNALLLLFARDSLWELVDPNALTAEAEPAAGGGSGGGGGGGGGADSTRDWRDFCTRVTVTLFSRPVSALYVRQFQLDKIEELHAQVTALFERLRQTLAERVQRSAWLDEETRAAALLKLSQLRGHFLTWPHFWNASYVETLLDDVEVDPENFFNNVINRYRQMRKVPPDIFEKPVPDKNWAYPFVVNAFYVLNINSIVIPLAVLTQPSFRASLPRYVPFATVGLLLAHEMLHAFDVAGIRVAGDGARRDWFSADARLRFEARLHCLASQYARAFSKQVAFHGSNVDVQFDWNATRSENMADVAALQVAHAAWRATVAAAADGPDARLPHIDLSARQLFFVAAAQSYCSTMTPEQYIVLVEVGHHTPHPERINGMMMNSPSFAEAFKCPVGSPMNPERKCATW